ncbi:MAG TPA: hypothetical protein VE961_04725, partial [Pyrinomonadaceae bacterium]|nr:hypothetical protein [Pyrinomonadaceae bacterium]
MKSISKHQQIVLVIMAITFCGVAFGLDYRHRSQAARFAEQRDPNHSASGGPKVATVQASNYGLQIDDPFAVPQSVFADGGGYSSGSGNLELNATTGQSAAGTTMTNGQYSVTSGFWQIEPEVIQSPTPTPTPT